MRFGKMWGGRREATGSRWMSQHEKAIEIIARVSKKDPATIRPDMDLVADLDIDSAKALELLVELEDTLGIEIDDDAAARLTTVGDILTYLETQTGEARGGPARP